MTPIKTIGVNGKALLDKNITALDSLDLAYTIRKTTSTTWEIDIYSEYPTEEPTGTVQ